MLGSDTICSLETLLHLVANGVDVRAIIAHLLRAVVCNEQHLTRSLLVRRHLTGRDRLDLHLMPLGQRLRRDMVALPGIGWGCNAGKELVALVPIDDFWSVWLRQITRLLRVGDTSSGFSLEL